MVVAKQKDYYEIIAGERRWRAAKIAGLKEVPVIIKDYSPQEIMEVALIENIQREDLNPIEEAKAYKNLIDEYNLKQDQVAEKVSKSRTAVTNALRLLKLDDRVQEMLINENISSGHARALLGLDDAEKQYNIATQIFDEKLSVRETEKLVKQINRPEQPPKPKKELKNDFVYRDIEEKLKEKIGTKVKINRKTEDKGKIEIEYYSPEELEKNSGIFQIEHMFDRRIKMFKFADIGLEVDIVVLGIALLVVILFIMSIVILSKCSSLKRRYEAFMADADGKSLEDAFGKKFENMEYINGKLTEIDSHLKEIDLDLLKTYQKVGIVKYDAFKEIGGTLSFVLTLLTKDNDGFIMNSMHSNSEGCYTYIKEVKSGEVFVALSEEEIQSLEMAKNVNKNNVKGRR